MVKLLLVLLLLLATPAWAQMSGGAPARQPISFAFISINENTTYFLTPGVSATNVNSGAITPVAGTLRNLYVRTGASPGTGQTYTITLYVGTPGSQSATSVTCQISGSAQTCNDLTDAASIAAGQAWSVQVVTSTSAASTATSMVGFEFDGS